MTCTSKTESHGAIVSAIRLLCVGVALALASGCTKSDPFPAEAAALQKLIDEYKLEWHKLDENGRVIDVHLEGPRYDDGALAIAGTFLQLEGMSIAWSQITDDGLEKLPVLKNLYMLNIIAPGVTDRGLLALRTKMPSLKDVWLAQTDKLTPAGMDSLKKSNPGVRIHVTNMRNGSKKKAAK
jgi:hypothetical protein